MNKLTVYLETSVVSYATNRLSRDLVTIARQQITRDWLAARSRRYELYISQLVVQEASATEGDEAQQRLALFEGVPLLAVTGDAGELARKLVDQGIIPATAIDDAVHVAVAAVNGVDFLLTWNYQHIANAALRRMIEKVCREAGYEPPVICTPEELTAEDA